MQQNDRALLAILEKKMGKNLGKKITFNKKGQIVALKLDYDQLTQVPVEVGQLTSLRELSLYRNQLTNLPPELGQLSNLRKLILNSNQLTQLPAELGQLSNLRELSLYSNRLTQLPSELGQLSNLQKLSLNHNQLTQLPMELGQLSNLRELTLHGNRLTRLPAELGQLANLRELSLSGNQLTWLPPELGQLNNLQELTLYNNWLTQLPAELGQLINLQGLSLYHNELTRLPSELERLSNLQRLYLSNNRLTQLPPELGRLISLQALTLSDNELTRVPAELGQLNNLQELTLHNNQLSELPPELGQLSNLHTLTLNDNELTQVPAELGQLSNLRELALYNNKLTWLPAELGQLSNLRELYLGNNELTQVPAELGQLSDLQKLSFRNNKLTQLPLELGRLSNLQKLILQGNSELLTPPPEIVEQKVSHVLAYLHALEMASMKHYGAKLLLVGEGGAGKSSLVRSLLGKCFDESLGSTRGINIETLYLPHPEGIVEPLRLNVWDFGREHIDHGTHQFFLTRRSVYLAVWNAQCGAEQGRVKYWLKTINVLAPDAPVLLVATHCDEHHPDLNDRLYKDAYPQVQGTFCVSNKDQRGMEMLRTALAACTASVPLMGQPWPTSWVEAENALSARKEQYVTVEKYKRICGVRGVQAKMAEGTLGGFLHDLGKILYFRDDPELSTLVVLNPSWLANAINAVLTHKSVRDAQGILAHSQLSEIWSRDEDGRPYEDSLYTFLLRLMERFGLIVPIEPALAGGGPTYRLAPTLLPHQPLLQ